MRGMMASTDPSLPLAATQPLVLQLRKRKVNRQTVVSPGAGPTADDGVSTGKSEKNATAGIHAVTRHTHPSEISSKERSKGPSAGAPVHQGRIGVSWKGKEEEELRKLVSLHTDPNGKISWGKIEEAWNQLADVSLRTKSSLSSKWRDLKSKPHLDKLTAPQSGSPSGGVTVRSKESTVPTSPIEPPKSTVVVDTHEIIVSSKSKTTSNSRRQMPSTIRDNDGRREKDEGGGDYEVENTGRIEEKEVQPDVRALFLKNLKKARKEGCKGFRKPLKRVKLRSTDPLMVEVDNLIKEDFVKRKVDKPTWNQLSIGVYAGAMTVDIIANRPTVEQQNRAAKWYKQTYVEMDKLRKTIGKATAELGRRKAEVAPTPRQVSNIRLLERKYHCFSNDDLKSLVERLKNRLQLLSERIELRKADEHRARLRRTPPKGKFVDSNGEDKSDSTDVHKIRRYWKNIVGVKKNFHANNQQLADWKQSLSGVPRDGDLRDNLTMEMWQEVMKKLKSWKASGPDGIQGFWWKSFPTANAYLYKLARHHLTTGTPLPRGWIANGRTVLIHKAGPKDDPSNFRPITCLNTCYKILTGYVAMYLSRYINERDILPKEQRALQKNIWGCTHALIVDQTVVADAFDQKQRPLSVAWIDYAKAFDSVPHKYILWVLEAMQVPSPLRKFIQSVMMQWRVKYEVRVKRGKVDRSQFLRIRSGVLQGDSFSPLLFCLSMAPLSHALNSSGLRYRTASGSKDNLQLTISHQFYMDDLKLYASSRKDLQKLLEIVNIISKAISMKVNTKKCATSHFVPKRLRESTATSASADDGDIPTLDGGKHYKYLGIDQNMQEEGDVSWDRVAKICLQKSKHLWASDLTYRQKVVSYNTTIIPALTYVSANLIKVSGKYESQLARGETFDVDIRKLLVLEKARYRSNCVNRLYTPVEKGGCGLKSVKDAMEETTIYTWAYLCTRADLKPSLNLFGKMANRKKRSIVTDVRAVLKSYNIQAEEDLGTSTVAVDGIRFHEAKKLAQYITCKMRDANSTRRLSEWKVMPLAGRVISTEIDIDFTMSFLWLKEGRLSSVGVRNTLAAQEGCLVTRTHPTHASQNSSLRCRRCDSADETVEHVIACCPTWLRTLYISRHDSVARNIYYTICRKYGIKPPHYTQRVNSVKETERIRLYWNQPVMTRTIIRHNKPDIIVFEKEKRTATIFEVAVSWLTGLQKQADIKVNRYTVNGNWDQELVLPYPRGDNIFAELYSMGWTATFVPVIIGATGEVLSDLKSNLQNSLGITESATLKLMERLQRSAVLGTSRVIKNHLGT
jgi:Reverse transcriptase (RNA-dependent DNA polymerase)